MKGESWAVGRLGGIAIRVHPSWVLIVVLIGYSFHVRIDTIYHDELASAAEVTLAAASALIFFSSVLLHELAHAAMARHRGIEVDGITLFLFGGATEAKVEGREPADELLTTIVGPLASVAIAGALGLVAYAIGDTSEPVPGTIGYLGWLNLALAIFNLVPGLPLDGGRVLRASLWKMTGNFARATRIAARCGQFVGWALAGLGLLNVLAGYPEGLWFVAIGWFLSQAAQFSYVDSVFERLVGNTTAGQMMTTDLITVPGELGVVEAIDEYFLRYDCSAFPVEANGRIVGMLSLRAVRNLHPDQRVGVAVKEIMTTLTNALVVNSDVPVIDVIESLRLNPDGRAFVSDSEGQIVGIITSRDLTRWLQRAEELDLAND